MHHIIHFTWNVNKFTFYVKWTFFELAHGKLASTRLSQKNFGGFYPIICFILFIFHISDNAAFPSETDMSNSTRRGFDSLWVLTVGSREDCGN